MHIDFISMVTAGHLKASQYKQFICNPLVKLNMKKIRRKETGSREEFFVRKCRRLSAEIPCTPNCPLPLQNVRNVLNFFLFFFHNQGKNISSSTYTYLGQEYFFFHIQGNNTSSSMFRARIFIFHIQGKNEVGGFIILSLAVYFHITLLTWVSLS